MLFEYVVFIGAVCGLIMIGGSMLLLYRGSITLDSASRDGTLSIEVLDSFKATTRNPALGLFLIGLVFFIVAAWFAQVGALKKLTIEGAISSPDQLADIEIHLSAGPWRRNIVDQSGKFSIVFHPHMQNMVATIVAPGYEKTGIKKQISLGDDLATIGEVEIGKRIVTEVTPSNSIPDRQSSAQTVVGDY